MDITRIYPGPGGGAVHSHDRTMLAGLGFADPDKRDPRHDLACQYIAAPEVARRLAEAVAAPILDALGPQGESREHYQSRWTPRLGEVGPVILEQIITKGVDQYRTTVGFLDCVVPFEVVNVGKSRRRDPYKKHAEWVESAYHATTQSGLLIEVKANPVGIGDVLRQLKLYGTYFSTSGLHPRPAWALATLYDLDAIEAETLARESIHHVRLGEAFDTWCDERERLRDGPARGDRTIVI